MNRTLLWDITYECNLRCVHCYNHSRLGDHDSSIIDVLQEDELVKRILSLGVDHIHLLGGEPLRENRIDRYLRRFKTEGLSVSVNTNGTLINKYERELLHYADQITISLDGADAKSNDAIRGEGVFDKVIRNVELFTDSINKNKMGPSLQIAVVLNAVNYLYIHKLPELLNSIGVNNLLVSRLYECSDSGIDYSGLHLDAKLYIKSLVRLLYMCYQFGVKLYIDCKPKVAKYLKETTGFNIEILSEYASCQAGHRFIYMNNKGNLFPCSPFSHERNCQKWNIADDDYIINFHQLSEVVLKQQSAKKDPICSACEFFYVCAPCNICGESDIDLCKYIVRN